MTINRLKIIQKEIYTARKIENNITHSRTINDHISNRYEYFNSNTSKMIKSILHKHTDPVILHNITNSEKIITEPEEIKDKVREHYENWTQDNPPNLQYWKD
jgi:23S rRNA maturation-related 3'-5' exoribonuclease YhaM